MATIYRFIVEQGTGKGSGGRNSNTESKKKTGKGKWVSIFGGSKGGVEHNRKMRALNPVFNKATAGYSEKFFRLSRAGAGLIQRNTETGKLGISGVAVAIIIAFCLQVVMKHHNKLIMKEQQMNKLNYKAMENGVNSVRGAYETSVNVWSGRITYNQNK